MKPSPTIPPAIIPYNCYIPYLTAKHNAVINCTCTKSKAVIPHYLNTLKEVIRQSLFSFILDKINKNNPKINGNKIIRKLKLKLARK